MCWFAVTIEPEVMKQRITVGIRPGRQLAADVAAGSRTVVDDYVCAQSS
jgi:hypothetical protein